MRFVIPLGGSPDNTEDRLPTLRTSASSHSSAITCDLPIGPRSHGSSLNEKSTPGEAHPLLRGSVHEGSLALHHFRRIAATSPCRRSVSGLQSGTLNGRGHRNSLGA